MSEKVSAFWPVAIGRFRYLFFLVNWSDFTSAITDSLERNINILGREIGLQGKVVQAYKRTRWQTYEEVKQKQDWPSDVRHRFDSEQYPFMLVLDRSFEEFEPGAHRWAVIWFSDFREHADSIPETFGKLVKQVREGTELFEYLREIALAESVKTFTEYFELKPGAFGVSVDVKAMFQDLAGTVRRQIRG